MRLGQFRGMWFDLDHILSISDVFFHDRMGSGGWFVSFDVIVAFRETAVRFTRELDRGKEIKFDHDLNYHLCAMVDGSWEDSPGSVEDPRTILAVANWQKEADTLRLWWENKAPILKKFWLVIHVNPKTMQDEVNLFLKNGWNLHGIPFYGSWWHGNDTKADAWSQALTWEGPAPARDSFQPSLEAIKQAFYGEDDG